MKTTLRLKVLLLLFLLGGLPAAGGSEWQLVKEGQGIKVYTAAGSGSRFKSIKVVAAFEGTPEKLRSILMNIDRQAEWVYGVRHSAILRQVSPHELLYYVETDLPWPASNRDAVIRLKIQENQAGQTLNIVSVGEPGAIATKPGIVRVPHYQASWQVKATGKDKLNFTYLLELDPGGNIPAWIVNLFVGKGPYESFLGLSEQLRK